eukprot:CAMPEP_0185693018 /NCGR_PEP_ID=MMETSP1164-20130828/2943_1 /TAXON_ID=1104430 /ORGANISM="Chrysoreinhardia sp, Strain CCMP2950" /LENGTH=103 /DNA_ID=CAMNT_0028359781 /DNA_START=67 /DNA_END=375 /DNA_ORIENTATION=+
MVCQLVAGHVHFKQGRPCSLHGRDVFRRRRLSKSLVAEDDEVQAQNDHRSHRAARRGRGEEVADTNQGESAFETITDAAEPVFETITDAAEPALRQVGRADRQ